MSSGVSRVLCKQKHRLIYIYPLTYILGLFKMDNSMEGGWGVYHLGLVGITSMF